MLEHCPPRYTGENTLCYRDGLLSKMTPASFLIYAKSTFDSWQCAMNFTILFRGTLKVDLVSLVWPPEPSKVSLSEKLSMILGVFMCFFLQNKSTLP